jgi:6-pyruvoyltetrahydropterin/6-carboxytetrahydropterin synthase
MSSRPRYLMTLEKEDFKFSAAHFTLFPDRAAERLHGHNYRVRLELAGEAVDDLGLLVDLDAVKRSVRAACARLDTRTLLPTHARTLEIEGGDDLEVRFEGRTYRFPKEDVVLLPITNVSIERLAELLWQELAAPLVGGLVEELTVSVEETSGQRCAYRSRLAPSPSA